MIIKTHNILTMLCRSWRMLCPLCVCIIFLCACSDSDTPLGAEDTLPDTGTVTPGELRAGFCITVSDNGPGSGSRAAGYLGDGYDTGEGYENYIDIATGNFSFYFFDSDSKLVAPINALSVVPLSQTATSKTYYVLGSCSVNIKNKPVKVVALINWGHYPDNNTLTPGTTTIADLCNVQYSFSPANMLPSADFPIPLFGVGQLQTLTFDDENRADVGTVHMLRAYAKVEVIRHEDCPIDIEWARIVRYNSRGFCAPQGVNNESDYVHYEYDKDYVNTPHIPSACEVDDNIPMVRTDKGTFVAYMPEFRNLTPSGAPRSETERTLIQVRFCEDTEREYDVVEFKDYKSGKHFDVLRNYWYRFTLSKHLEPMVQMVPYNEVDLSPDFGLIVGPNYVPVLDDNNVILYWYDPATGKYYGPDKVTEVTNPYISVDPVTGWSLCRDDNNRFFCYHDTKNNHFYATDKSTRIRNPYERAVNLTIDGKELTCNEIRGLPTDEDKDGKLYYYYDRAHSVWYRPNLTALGSDEDLKYD